MKTIIVNTQNAKYKVTDIHGNVYKDLNRVLSVKMFEEHALTPEGSILFERDGKLFHFIQQNVILIESTGHNFEGYANE